MREFKFELYFIKHFEQRGENEQMIQCLISKFENIFQNIHPGIRSHKASFKISEEAKPIIRILFRVPFSVMNKVEKEINSLFRDRNLGQSRCGSNKRPMETPIVNKINQD
ncbi:hypothetical protein RF11_05319 [Thelohanellus kitauei]|uniref:Uncharacterized protein n=1 Tax=Thelohanellus kitauei TaxID=669202 RepID=A0A0C2MVB5_THEKT|nr:hypothetical protein RF11_05319 [Thelohanellus kitauei]